MPTRKQRKRSQKERRHEYETVWVDSEGNELEEPPDDAPAPVRERSDGRKPQQKRTSQRSSRATRAPQAPSWRRSIRRSLILGAVFLVVFAMLQGPVVGLVLAAFYAALFIPFTYYIDRFAYRRWERNQPKKR